MTVYLKAWRESRGKSQKRVATACGLSNSQISRIEAGKQGYTQPVLEGYARCLGCLVEDLFHPPNRMFVVDGWQRLMHQQAAERT